MNKFTKVILAIFVFCLMQILGGGIIALFAAFGWKTQDAYSPTPLAIALLFSGISTALILSKGMKMIDFRETFSTRNINWKQSSTACLSALAGIFAINITCEFMSLTDKLTDAMMGMAHSFLGVLSICVIGPVVEELVFREAILGHMLRNNVNKWRAFVISALAFGIIHMNPAQVPAAFAIGFVFAIVYYKTRNIVITSIIHIINNSMAVVEMHILGDEAESFSIVEWLGGNIYGIAYAIVLTGLCAYGLSKFWINYDNGTKQD